MTDGRDDRVPNPKHSQPAVPVKDKLRWNLSEAAAMTNVSPNSIRDKERKGEFPPRVPVKGSKSQFIAAEVRAWGNGQDWRAMVAARSPEASRAT